MSVLSLQAENFRLFRRLTFAPGPGLNLIAGSNAAGKTTVLEAAYVLGRRRSFRGGEPVELLGSAAESWVAQAWLDAEGRVSLGLQWSAAGFEVRRQPAGDLGAAEAARLLPVQILDPAGHRLVEEGPAYRRRYLDWGVFHVEPRFYPLWRRYSRALKQRNRALKLGAADAAVRAWDQELAEAGEGLHALRLEHLDGLRAELEPLLRQLLDQSAGAVELSAGWSESVGLAAALHAHLERDRRMGSTLDGPHRAELRLRLGERPARHRVSRGQQKLLVAALVLAQARLMRLRTSARPLLLVDDYPSELGASFQERLLQALRASDCQVILTALDPAPFQAGAQSEDRLFHVEQGVLSPA